ncbi:hypothetical protein ACFV8Z_34315, partial [Streptomyces sp. NPDC059837]
MYSRMIVGWQLATHMRTELPLGALEMALWRRGVKKGSGLIHHSDGGINPGCGASLPRYTRPRGRAGPAPPRRGPAGDPPAAARGGPWAGGAP